MSNKTEVEIYGFAEEAFSMVGEFIEAFNGSNDPETWVTLNMEEAKEVINAEGPAEALKETCDLFYVVTGMLYCLRKNGLARIERDETPFEQMVLSAGMTKASLIRHAVGEDAFREAFRRVHASNMSKLGEDGKPIHREDGKVLKGPNYKPPVMDDLVRDPEAVLN